MTVRYYLHYLFDVFKRFSSDMFYVFFFFFEHVPRFFLGMYYGKAFFSQCMVSLSFYIYLDNMLSGYLL